MLVVGEVKEAMISFLSHKGIKIQEKRTLEVKMD